MNELAVFNFEGNDVRQMIIENEPWFLGKDVAEVLGYSNIHKAIKQHTDEEDRKTLMYKASPRMGQSLWDGNDYSNKTLINESGLYTLIFGSKLESAKRFKRWVTSEVLPKIRKTGSYGVSNQSSEITDLKIELSNTKNAVLQMQNEMLTLRNDFLQSKSKIENNTVNKVERHKLYNITDIAKLYGAKAAKFNKFLEREGIQHKVNGRWQLVEEYRDRGLVEYKSGKNRRGAFYNQIKWTEKGKQWIYNYLKDTYKRLPEEEKAQIGI